MDTNSFTIQIKTDGNQKDIAEDVETRFDTSNYELDRALSKGKNKEVTELWQGEFAKKNQNQKVCWTKSKNLYLFNR